MSEKTASWTWQSLESERSVTGVTQEHLARIRRLVAYWEPAENGAAGLADEGFLELHGSVRDDFQAAVEVFMNAAELPSFEGTIVNPYARAGADEKALLEDTPDGEVAALLLSGRDIDLKATPEELALWAQASLGSNGIDPKRPFGSESVSRDVRAIVDPDKRLSNAAFSRKRKHLEARLLLLLQFFVQNARLEPGTYRRGDDWRWRRVEAGDPLPGELLTRQEWRNRMYLQTFYEYEDYAETLRCLIHLVWNNRLAGSYAALAQQFKLANHFDSEFRRTYEGSTEERLRAALEHFPERRGNTERPWFTLALARMLNAQARFAEARSALERADLYEIAPEEVDLSTLDPLGVAFLEGIVARRGLEILDEDEFQSVIAGSHSLWRTQTPLWELVWYVQREAGRYEGAADGFEIAQAQALAAQIELMRGGYQPDYEVKRF